MHIINANILTMEGQDFPCGYIKTENGKIAKLGPMSDLNLSSADSVYDVAGAYVLPGFVEAHCHLGMWEDSLGFEGDDGNEETDPITPQLLALDGINPLDRGFREAAQGGVTTVVTGPGSANVMGGQFLAMKTVGSRVDDMVIKNPVALKLALGENPKTVYHQKNQSPSTRMATASLIRDYLNRAREYKDNLDAYNRDSEENDKPEYDQKLEALLLLLEKKIPAKVHAHRSDDMFTAIRIAKEFDIDITLEHCTEGHLMADALAMEKIPVMVGPSLCDRSKPELKNLTFATPGVLSKKGLSVAIITDHPVVPVQYINLCAALAVREGMDETEALRAITINAAKNTGISDRVGSLSPGKDADIVVFEKHPLDSMAKPKAVFVDGRQAL